MKSNRKITPILRVINRRIYYGAIRYVTLLANAKSSIKESFKFDSTLKEALDTYDEVLEGEKIYA